MKGRVIMKKRIKSAICTALFLAMLLNVAPVSIASLSFDGTQSSWAEPELREASENGLTTGR